MLLTAIGTEMMGGFQEKATILAYFSSRVVHNDKIQNENKRLQRK